MAKKPKKSVRKQQQDEIATTVVKPPVCPNCGSTRRSQLVGVRTQTCRVTVDGQEFNKVTLAYTTCQNCGRKYRIRSFRAE